MRSDWIHVDVLSENLMLTVIPYTKPKTIVGYVNVYEDRYRDVHRTIQQAIINKGSSAKQTLKITMTDGVPTVEVVEND